MNEKPTDPKEKLLNDVLQDESYPAFHDRLKRQALAEFRCGHFLRKIASVSAWAATLAALIAGSVFFRSKPTQNISNPPIAKNIEAPPPPANESPAARMPAPQAIPTLTDEELIASFPPDTCFLAEVDGRKILVFRSDELRKQFLH